MDNKLVEVTQADEAAADALMRKRWEGLSPEAFRLLFARAFAEHRLAENAACVEAVLATDGVRQWMEHAADAIRARAPSIAPRQEDQA